MKKYIIFIAIAGLFLHCKQTKELTKTDYQLVWADEFDVEGLPNANKWSYDIGTACEKPAGCGWGNKELQYYTDKRTENARVENGHLIIEAHKEPYQEDRTYTSARLTSKHKGDWTYGKMEIRAKLPTGRGTWPAIWMLYTNDTYGGWPESGEIDIMEHVGYDQDTIFGTVHTKSYNGMIGTEKGRGIYNPQSEKQFQVYTIEWNEEKIDWFINDEKYHTFANDKTDFKGWPFDHAFHLIMNLAVGGNWAGRHGVDESIWPQRMEVDYVRVYQQRTIAD